MKNLNVLLLAAICSFQASVVFGQGSKAPNGISPKWNPSGFESTASAVPVPYYFSTYQSTYTDLQGATSLNGGEVWDDPEFELAIGFSFNILGYDADSLFFAFGLGGMVSTSLDEDPNNTFMIMPFGADLMDRGYLLDNSQSNISYKLEGTQGSRILKVEWKNVGFYDEADQLETLNDYINFQMWLYEGLNDIEFHFGTSSIVNPGVIYYGETGTLCGISDYELVDNHFLTGPVANPSMQTITETTLAYLNGTPGNGTVYKFARSNVSVEELAGINFNIYPNPVNDVLTLSVKGEANHSLVIIDVTGRVVTSQNLTATQTSIETSEFAPGVYIIRVIDAKGNSSARKFVKN